MHHDLLLIGVPLAAFSFLFFRFCPSESQSLPLDTDVCFQFLTNSLKKKQKKNMHGQNRSLQQKVPKLMMLC